MKTEIRTVRVLASAQVLNGLGVAGTVAAVPYWFPPLLIRKLWPD